MHVEACLCCLQRKKGLDEHAGSSQKHEGCGDLRDGEDAQPAAGAAGDARAAAGEPESLRGTGGRQPRYIGKENRSKNGESSANPQHAGVDGEIERTNREARGIAGKNRNHWTGAEHTKNCTGTAEQKTFGKKSAAQGSARR